MPTDSHRQSVDSLGEKIAGLSKAGWSVAPAIAEFAARNPAFKRAEAALRRYMDQNLECLHAIHALLKDGSLESHEDSTIGRQTKERRQDAKDARLPSPNRAAVDRRRRAERRTKPRRR